MHIAILQLKINIPQALNLKNKRKVVNSLMQKLKNKFNITIAEIANNDAWQLATIGIASVSNDAQYLQQVMNKLLDMIDEMQGDFYLMDHQLEIIIV